MAKIQHNNGQVLVCTDDVEAAKKNLLLVTFDRAHGLVTGGHAVWLEAPEAPKEEQVPAGEAAADAAPAGAAAALD
jgi:hypothetical protein